MKITERKSGLDSIGTFFFFIGFLIVILNIMGGEFFPNFMAEYARYRNILVVILGVIFLITSVGLWYRQKWARMIALVSLIIMLCILLYKFVMTAIKTDPSILSLLGLIFILGGSVYFLAHRQTGLLFDNTSPKDLENKTGKP